MDRRTLLVRIVTLAAIIALVAWATEVYRSYDRHAGDVVIAADAVEGLTFIERNAIAMGESTPYSNALEDYFFAIDLFLASESSARLPDVAEHVQHSWTAFRVADQLWRLAEDGEMQPLVSDVYAGAEVITFAPSVAASIVGVDAEARFDNENLAAVETMFQVAAAERLAASERVIELESEAGLR